MRSVTKSVKSRGEENDFMLAMMRASAAGASRPLSRYRFIDGGTPVVGGDGAIALPYATSAAFLADVAASASIADASALFVGKVTPSEAGYAETLVFPAYRQVELRADETPIQNTGTITWPNVAGGGTHVPSPYALMSLHNYGTSGAITVTDDGGAPSNVFITADNDFVSLYSSFDSHTTTALATIYLNGVSFSGAVNLGTAATSAIAGINNSDITGLLTAQAVSAELCTLRSVTVRAGQSAQFIACIFNPTPVLTGGAGSIGRFDGPSWRSFLEAGGTLAGGIIALIIGGYSAGSVAGQTLTDANVTVSLNGAGASGGFTAGGNWYDLPAATLSANRSVTLLTGGALPGDTIRITRFDATAHTYTVLDDLSATLAVLPASQKGFVDAQFNGTHWVFIAGGAGIT